jgi:hypothetical protein
VLRTTTAQAALPKFRDVTDQIARIDGLIGQMTPEQRKLVAGIVTPLMATINPVRQSTGNPRRFGIIEAGD